jgi:hypothetical protein
MTLSQPHMMVMRTPTDINHTIAQGSDHRARLSSTPSRRQQWTQTRRGAAERGRGATKAAVAGR